MTTHCWQGGPETEDGCSTTCMLLDGHDGEHAWTRDDQISISFPARTTPHPSECPHCEYDRRFPGFEGGGWMQQDNNGPIVSCPMCNDDGKHPSHPSQSQAR